MTAPTQEPQGPRPARRDQAPQGGAQRGHPRALLPEAGNPGPRRFRRRQPRPVAQGGGDRRRGHRLLRRALHGRDRENPEPGKDRHPARHGRRLQPRRQLPARPVRGVPRGASRPYRADLHQLLGGGEGALRHHRHQLVGRHHPQADPEGAEDHLRPRPPPRRLSRAADRARDAAVAGHLHRPPGVQRNRAVEAQGRASRRAGRGASRMPAAHHRPCRSCRLDQVDPGFRDRLARADTILVATEPHIIHQMEKAAPHKTFIGTPGGDGNCNCNMCPYMALNTLEKLYVALRDLQPRIELSPEVMEKRACRWSGCWRWPGGRSGRAMSGCRRSRAIRIGAVIA